MNVQTMTVCIQLNQLYEKYRGMGFTVLAFPCNQFGGQEPGDEPNIKEIVRNEHVRCLSIRLLPLVLVSHPFFSFFFFLS